MFYKILDGGIFVTKIFDKSCLTLTTCEIKKFIA
jgi:hypothetical protein